MATETIKLNSKTGQHIVKAVTADSTLTCIKTSASDVYVNVSQDRTHTLSVGDSMLAAKRTINIWLFRKFGGDSEFFAELELKTV